MNRYMNLLKKQQEEYNAIPIMWACTKPDLIKEMKKCGLSENDFNKIYSVGCCGYVTKENGKKLFNIKSKHKKELWDNINEDKSGDGFIFDMFDYELANHEYNYTGDINETLDAIGLTTDEIKTHNNLSEGLKKAIENNKKVINWI